MTYYVTSPFNNVPVLNIDTKAYGKMTANANYRRASFEKLEGVGVLPLTFVTITAKSGMNTEYESCINNLKDRGLVITKEVETNFLSYTPQMLVVIFGKITK